jgi:hypothetical protein
MKTIVALAMLAVSGGAAAQINKCLDSSGKVVGYGDCPPGTRSEASTVKSAPTPPSVPAAKPAASGSSAPQSSAEKDADFRKRQLDKKEAEEKAAKKQASAEQNQRACEEARAYLKSLQAGNRITKNDPKSGERVFLQDNEYASETARTQKTIQANCR